MMVVRYGAGIEPIENLMKRFNKYLFSEAAPHTLFMFDQIMAKSWVAAAEDVRADIQYVTYPDGMIRAEDVLVKHAELVREAVEDAADANPEDVGLAVLDSTMMALEKQFSRGMLDVFQYHVLMMQAFDKYETD
jgi:hypothetical protein